MHKIKPRQLSDRGLARKQSMLHELQMELEQQRVEQFRRVQFAGALALLIVSGIALALSFPTSETVVETRNRKAVAAPRFPFASVESNRQEIADRYVECNDQNSSFSFEAISDAELVRILKSTGDKFVLGEIDGQKMLLPARMSP